MDGVGGCAAGGVPVAATGPVLRSLDMLLLACCLLRAAWAGVTNVDRGGHRCDELVCNRTLSTSQAPVKTSAQIVRIRSGALSATRPVFIREIPYM